MANAVDKIIKIALDEVGYLEKKSNYQLDDKTANAGYGNFTKYARDLDAIGNFYNYPKNGYPWCDVFFDWLVVKAFGVDNAKKILNQPNYSLGAGCVFSARYYRDIGRFYTSNPQVGDQIFFGSYGNEEHTGIVYKVDTNNVYTIEGNTSGASGVVANGGGVCKKSYAINYYKIVGYGRPNYDGYNSVQTQTPTVPTRNYLMRGDKGAEVRTMQENLIKLGYSCGRYGADGDFGNDTEVAVRKFQSENSLVVDGKFGEKSKAKMDALLAKPAPQPQPQPTNKIDTIKEVQNWVNANYKSVTNHTIAVDGIYGYETKTALVKALQIEINKSYRGNLIVDGIWGIRTMSACPTLMQGYQNGVVAVLQALLICNGIPNVYVDGIYGSVTATAVGIYQNKVRLVADKLAGKNTFAKLCG